MASRHVAGRCSSSGAEPGRISLPLARAGAQLVGIDRSAPMLARAQTRARGVRRRARGAAAASRWCAATSAHLPFADARFGCVIAPYGILQSLLSRTRPGGDARISRSRAEARRALRRRPRARRAALARVQRPRSDARPRARRCASHADRVGPAASRRRRMTTFEQRYLVRRGRDVREHRFEPDFQDPAVPAMTPASGTGRIRGRGRARRLPRARLGRARRRLDPPGGKGVRFSVRSR